MVLDFTFLDFPGCFYFIYLFFLEFPGGSDGKAFAYNEGDLGSFPEWGRPSGEGNGIPLQYSCLENPMYGGAWYVIVHGVPKSQTRLIDFTYFCRAVFGLKQRE